MKEFATSKQDLIRVIRQYPGSSGAWESFSENQ